MKCSHDICQSDLPYQYVEFREHEIVPTGEGGDFISKVLRFCSAECLLTVVKYLKDQGKIL
jgi:hypothetical protein